MEPLIQVKNVTKIYRMGASNLSVTALRSVTLDFARGEFAAIAGPSGSGKSTLLNVIGTIDVPTKGEVLYEGLRVSAFSENQQADFRLHSLGFITIQVVIMILVTVKVKSSF